VLHIAPQHFSKNKFSLICLCWARWGARNLAIMLYLAYRARLLSVVHPWRKVEFFKNWRISMSKIVTLKAAARGRAGKGAARSVRREGLVPGVVYGDKKDPQIISLTYKDVEPHVNTGRFLATLVDLDVDGATVRAIPRDIQFDPVKDRITHVDFLRLGKDARIAVNIPVHFKNHDAAPGIKAGGVLNIVSHYVNLYCPADFIPDEIIVDLTGMQVSSSIHISGIKLPDRVTSAARDDVTLCAISAQSKEEAAAEAAVAAGDVPAANQKAPDPKAKAAAPAKGAAPAKAAAAPAAKKK
jgi:large subunit ribosomal protein L25